MLRRTLELPDIRIRRVAYPPVLALAHQAAEKVTAGQMAGSHSTADFTQILGHASGWLFRYIEYNMKPDPGDIEYLNFTLSGIPVRPPTSTEEYHALLDAFVNLLWACNALANEESEESGLTGSYPVTPFDAAKNAPFAPPEEDESPLDGLELLSPLDAGVHVFASDRAFGAVFGPVDPLA